MLVGMDCKYAFAPCNLLPTGVGIPTARTLPAAMKKWNSSNVLASEDFERNCGWVKFCGYSEIAGLLQYLLLTISNILFLLRRIYIIMPKKLRYDQY